MHFILLLIKFMLFFNTQVMYNLIVINMHLHCKLKLILFILHILKFKCILVIISKAPQNYKFEI